MARQIYKNADGKRVPSVTTILGVLDKPALKFWANKLGLEGIKVTEYVDDKAMIGTLAHYILECYIKNEEPDFAQFNCTDEQIEQARVCTKKFFEWEAYQEEFKPIASELHLVSEKLQYGGTIDLIARLNGKITLIDFKTCNAIYEEPYYQTAGYENLAREHGYDIEQVVILRIGRDEEEGFEYLEHKTLTQSFAVFLAAKTLYENKKEFEKEHKKALKEVA